MLFRAMRGRNYRLFFIGQTLSVTGSWLQQAAMSWLVYRLTGSAALLGMVIFLSQAPVAFVAPFVPWLTERIARDKLFIFIQVSAMVYAFALATLAWGGWAAPWNILLLAGLAGCVTGMESPLRQGMLGYLIAEPGDLSNAVVLNSLCFNVTRLIGPVLAGLLIGVTSEAFCFFVNGMSFLAVIAAFRMMKLPDMKKTAGKAEFPMGATLQYAWSRPRIRNALVMLFVVAVCFTPNFVVMPVYAKTVFQGDASTLGNLMAAAGLGSMLATVVLLWIGERVNLTVVTMLAAFAGGVSLAVFALSTDLWVAYALIAIVGFSVVTASAGLNIVLQTVCEPRHRTAIVSLYSMSYAGMVPFSSLALGWASNAFGTPQALHGFAVVGTVAVALLIGRLPPVRRKLRPIHRKVLLPLLSR